MVCQDRRRRTEMDVAADGVVRAVHARPQGGEETGHEIRASKTRGQAQAAWVAIEGWQYFAAAGFDNGTIRRVVMPGWNVGVQRWAKALIRPDQILLPPRPHETIDPETQATLDAIRDSLDVTYDTLPREADIRPRSLR